MADRDQKYRNALSLGTLDKQVLAKDAQMRKKASIEEYIAFAKTITKTLNKSEIDSLWLLQKELDYVNYIQLVALVKTHGYPSPTRLGQKTDAIYPILLHPPTNSKEETQVYLRDLSKLLKPEVLAGRMAAKSYVGFVDNIKTKILQEPQLYGTVKSFNPKLMKEGLPKIANIGQTNRARKELGLPYLAKGSYELVE